MIFGNKRGSNVSNDVRSVRSDNSNLSEKRLREFIKLKKLQQSDSNPSFYNKYSEESKDIQKHPPTMLQNYVTQNKSTPYVGKNSFMWNFKNKKVINNIGNKIQIGNMIKLNPDSSSMINISSILNKEVSSKTPCSKNGSRIDKNHIKIRHKPLKMVSSVSREYRSQNQPQNVHPNDIPEFTLGPNIFNSKNTHQINPTKPHINPPNWSNYDSTKSFQHLNLKLRHKLPLSKELHTINHSDTESPFKKPFKNQRPKLNPLHISNQYNLISSNHIICQDTCN